jgi:glycolate oxidase
VVTGHLKKEAHKLGLFYPPDPASLEFCTIGGNVATCAGGASALKYGVTRDYVLGLEAVLATGEVARTGVRTAKGVVGYDLTRLIVGSEGTLAVATKIVLKLIPRPPTEQTLVAAFDSMEAAADAVSAMLQRGIVPASLEFMDRLSMSCVKEKLGTWAKGDTGALLIVKVDGDDASVKNQAQAARQTLIDAGVRGVRAAQSEEEAEAIWAARRAISPAAFRLAPHKVSEDITVPRSRLPEAVAGIRSIAKEHDLPVLCFGHAGDGNIHVNLMIDRSDPDQVARAEVAVKEIFGLTMRLEGTLSGEHGVGITKAPYLGMELDKLGIDLMRRIKQAFDPNNILNPGKLFLDDTAQDPFLSGRV